jgi:hypothetical protein
MSDALTEDLVHETTALSGERVMSDTHRRAKLRGRGAVAHWKISGAVWAGRLFAVMIAVGAVSALLSGRSTAWIGALVLLVMAVSVLLATWRLGRGSRAAAVSLLCLYLFAKLSSWKLGGESLSAGALWSVLLIGAFGNGIWGTFELAAIARESEAMNAESGVPLPDDAALPSAI